MMMNNANGPSCLKAWISISLMSLFTIALGLALAVPAYAGTVEFTIQDDKGNVTIPPGKSVIDITSSVHFTLGAVWGELAGNYKLSNEEQLVVVNNGPAFTADLVDYFPVQIAVPEPPNPAAPLTFFDIFAEVQTGGGLGPLQPGMSIAAGPSTTLQGASGTLYQGIVTQINNLSQLPTSSANDTQIVWNLSSFNTTVGNFYLIQYNLPNAYEATVPLPATLLLLGPGLLGLAGARRRFKK